ncbi:MAG: hypothetical protein AAFY98_03095 [Verrucomicrobiota bacterium]
MKASEKRLGLILGGLVLLFLGLLAFNFYRSNMTKLNQQKTLLNSTATEQEIWLRQSDLWLDRQSWVQSNQPTIGSPRAATADLSQSLESEAKALGLTFITPPRLQEPVYVPEYDYHEISVSYALDGNLENLVKWALAAQQPKKFRLFKRFTLNTREDAPTLRVDCTVVQWCKVGEAGEVAEEEEIPEPEEEPESETEESLEVAEKVEPENSQE